MFCPECGMKVNDGAKFCPNCGTRLQDVKQDLEISKTEETSTDTKKAAQTLKKGFSAFGKGAFSAMKKAAKAVKTLDEKGDEEIVKAIQKANMNSLGSSIADTVEDAVRSSANYVENKVTGSGGKSKDIDDEEISASHGETEEELKAKKEEALREHSDAILSFIGTNSRILFAYEDKIIVTHIGRFQIGDDPIPYKDVAAINYMLPTDNSGGAIRFAIPSRKSAFGALIQGKYNLSVTFSTSDEPKAKLMYDFISTKITESRSGKKFFSNVLVNQREVAPEDAIHIGSIYSKGNATNEERPVVLSANDLTMHTFVTGSTGAGKSNTVYRLLQEIRKRNGLLPEEKKVHFLVIEPAKGEYKEQFKSAAVFGTNAMQTNLLRLNPFSFPEGIHVLEHIDRLCEIFNACWPMSAAMPAVLKESIEKSYIAAGWSLQQSKCIVMGKEYKIFPTFADVLAKITEVIENSEFSGESKGDYIGALSTRVRSLTNGIYGEIFTCNELSNEELFDQDVILDLSRVGSSDTRSLLMGITVLKLQEYKMSQRDSGILKDNSGLRHLTVLEEAHNLLKKTSTDQSADSSNVQGMAVQMLSNIIAEMRTYGEGFIIADQAPGLLDLSVIRNTNTKIIHRLPNEEDRKLVGKAAALSDAQIEELAHLGTGVAAVYQNNWPQPVLCQIAKASGPDKQSSLWEDFSETYAYEYLLIDCVLGTITSEFFDNGELETAIEKAQLSAETKMKFIKFIAEDDSNIRKKMRIDLIGDMFNTMDAVNAAKSSEADVVTWTESMKRMLVPSLEHFSPDQQNLILLCLALYAFHRNEDKKMIDFAEQLQEE